MGSGPIHISIYHSPFKGNLSDLFLNVPDPKGPSFSPLSSSRLSFPSLSQLTHLPLLADCPVQRGEGTAERGETEEGRNRKWCSGGGGGRDEFHRRATRLYTFLKGCASCSFVPTSHTHTTLHVRMPHTLLNPPSLLLPQWCPLFLQHTPYRTGNGDFFFLYP